MSSTILQIIHFCEKINSKVHLDNDIIISYDPNMELKEYIKLKRIRQSEAAREIGITRQYLNMILKGHAKPGIRSVKAIIRWTGGAVRFEDLI